MVNLMYLVFIAMLALNIGKEVLAAFGSMNSKLEVSNAKIVENNQLAFNGLETKKEENPTKYGKLYDKATQIKAMSDEFYQYLEKLKVDAQKDVTDKTDYTTCLLYTSPSPRDKRQSRMPSSA